MTLFWPFLPAMSGTTVRPSRQTRLRELEARMSSFLSEKQASRSTCPQVLDNVKAARSTVQREMAAAHKVG